MFSLSSPAVLTQNKDASKCYRFGPALLLMGFSLSPFLSFSPSLAKIEGIFVVEE